MSLFSMLPVPIVDLPVLTSNGSEMQLDAPDLSLEPKVRVYDAQTGETHYLSLQATDMLRNYALSALHGVTAVQHQRFARFHPARSAELAPLIRQGMTRMFSAADGSEFVLGFMLMSSTEADPAWQTLPREGEPKMVWQPGDAAGNGCGWSLTLEGAGDGTQLGFAPWDDPEAIARLVQAVQDRQSAFIMSGIVDSQGTARLSSRMTALSLRRGRKLPAIRLKQVRDILTEAQLVATNANANQYTSARGRVLSIEIDEAAVPIAVFVLAPQRPAQCVPFPEGIETMPWDQRQQVITDIETDGRAAWTEAAKTALLAKGWRIIELPLPNLQYAWRLRNVRGIQQGVGYFFATRIKPEIWSEIEPAALSAAADLNLNRSSLM